MLNIKDEALTSCLSAFAYQLSWLGILGPLANEPVSSGSRSFLICSLEQTEPARLYHRCKLCGRFTRGEKKVLSDRYRKIINCAQKPTKIPNIFFVYHRHDEHNTIASVEAISCMIASPTKTHTPSWKTIHHHDE